MKPKIQTFLLAVAACFSPVADAQNNAPAADQTMCGTEIPGQQWEQAIQKFMAENADVNSKSAVYTIPVIVHVVHGNIHPVGTYPNLAQGQIASQIQVLNEDFAGTGYNSASYPASAFSTWAANQLLPPSSLDNAGRVKIANCNVQFCLATVDTLGNPLPEPGIDRVNYKTKGWSNPNSKGTYNSFKNFVDDTVKPQTIWNPTKYFNIWISDVAFGSLGLLGYATFPNLTGLQGLTTALGTGTTDGIWCYARAFGSVGIYPSGTYYSGYNRGRTASHEAGHWLGLRHIWGDSQCGNDYCADTPLASNSNNGSPNYPYKTTNCNGNSPNGEMFMNIMDYTSDAAKYMFTTNQADRIQTAMQFGPYRKFLGTHNLCSVAGVAATSSFNIPASTCGTAVITVTNFASGIPAPTHTWSSVGGAIFAPNNNAPVVNIIFPATGTYVVTQTTDNGTLSLTSRTIHINAFPIPTLATSKDVYCHGEDIILTASGGTSYVWYPGVHSGDTVYLPGNLWGQTFTCAVNGPGNCQTIDTLQLKVADCTGLAEKVQNHHIVIYPNPVSDIVNIQVNSGSDFVAEIADVTGKIIYSRCFEVNAAHPAQFDTGTLPKGLYFITVVMQDENPQVFKLIRE